ASIEERADRRYQELRQRGEEIDFDSILAKLRERDLIDSTREIAPLKPADDAILIDTDQLSIQQVFTKILEIVKENRVK
ncbi:MAG: (d)CMP kinase, partial [Chloroflexota bacterium]